MYINLRLLNRSDQQKIIKYHCRSINETIAQLKTSCLKIFSSNCDSKVRLFFSGKELNDVHTLLDYAIKINDHIQVLIQKDVPMVETNIATAEENEAKSQEGDLSEDYEEFEVDEFYRVGDKVNCLHEDLGAFFEGEIARILKVKGDSSMSYEIKYYLSSLPGLQRVTIDELQPLFNERVDFDSVREGEVVLVNWNLNDAGLLGYWYNFHVIRKSKTHLVGDLRIGCDVFIRNQKIPRDFQIFKVFPNRRRESLSEEELQLLVNGPKERRLTAAECVECNDNPEFPCTECACSVCGQKQDPNKQVYCDECNKVYHFWCHPCPLTELPVGDWYCHLCVNEDRKLIELKEQQSLSRKRKRKLGPALPETKFNWGHGISCIGRSVIPDLVPKDYFGALPDIPVGTWWRFRFQASEAGIHTPLVAGIHGKENLGAFSVVFCCGYEDDVDLGDEIYFTGSGGKQSDGTKSRVGGPQVKDQELKRCNKALAMNCAAKFSELGANSGDDWRLGKPVRVLRSGNARGSSNRSPYLPKLGVRYDGLYKVVKYWPERKVSGFLVWRFLLRRDDEAASPWSKQGKKRIKKIGLELINPPGYEDRKAKKSLGKRVIIRDNDEVAKKRFKTELFQLPDRVRQLISLDLRNQVVWSQLSEFLHDKKTFLVRLEEAFKCGCCLDIVSRPMTTNCGHNICKECLDHSLKSEVTKCPFCRSDMTSRLKRPRLNHNLAAILADLIPNYKQRTGQR